MQIADGRRNNEASRYRYLPVPSQPSRASSCIQTMGHCRSRQHAQHAGSSIQIAFASLDQLP